MGFLWAVGSGGMVVTRLFGCFFNGFVAAYLLGLWCVWGHGGYCAVVTGLFGCSINSLWLVCGSVFTRFVLGLGSW